MHKLESFALSAGSKINKPYINECFFPNVNKDYICISKDHYVNSEHYDYFDDVLFHIAPFLSKENISILEIGKSEYKNLFYGKSFKNLNIHQNSYLIKRSKLYIGNINIFAHIASHFNKNIICPINKNYLESIAPFWSQDKAVILQPDTQDKPLLSNIENPKTINSIKPELIAAKILDTLSIDHDLNSLETIYTGENYDKPTSIDILPSQNQLASYSFNHDLDIRMDKHYDLNFLYSCNNLKSFNITTDKVIPLNFLNALKSKIDKIKFIINKGTSIDDVNSMYAPGVPVELFTNDSDNIMDIRLKFIDFDVFPIKESSLNDIDVDSIEGLEFLSRKNIFFEGKLYNSYKSIDGQNNTSNVHDSEEFWENLSYYRIYKK